MFKYTEKLTNGFTLIEILIVVLLVGLLYSVVLPVTQRTYEKFQAMRKLEDLKAFLSECKRQAFLYGEKIEIIAVDNSLRAGEMTFSGIDLTFRLDHPIVFFPLGTTSGGKIGIYYKDSYYELEILPPQGEIRLTK